MATSSLGRLTLDLAVRLSEFTDGMSRAERETADRTQRMQESVTSFREHLASELGGTQLGGIIDTFNERFGSLEGSITKVGGALAGMAVGGMVIGIGALSKMAVETAKADAEMAIFAQQANTTVESFQVLSKAAEGLGYSQEQLSSVLADTQEKLGEFTATEGGGAADFFDALKNNTKMTDDQIRQLGKTLNGKDGVEAVQLIKNKMDELGATSQEQRFVFESLASDLTNLLPLFEDGGKLLGVYGDELRKAGVIKTKEAIEQSQILAAQTQSVQQRFSVFKTQLSSAMMPVLNSLLQHYMSGSEKGAAFGGVIQSVAVVAKGAAAIILTFTTAVGMFGNTIGQVLAQLSNLGDTYVAFENAEGVIAKAQALAQGFRNARTMGSDWWNQMVSDAKRADATMGAIVNGQNGKLDALTQANLKLEQSNSRANDGLKISTKQADEAAKAQEKLNKEKEKGAKLNAASVAVAAAQDVGVTEAANPNKIMGYQRAVGYMSGRIDAWCASFVGAALEKSGFKSTRSASARSYDNYGVGINKNGVIPSGAIATVARSGGSGRHVFIVERDLGNGKVATIEGNAGRNTDRVIRGVRDKSQLITVRIPITKDGKVADTGTDGKSLTDFSRIDDMRDSQIQRDAEQRQRQLEQDARDRQSLAEKYYTEEQRINAENEKNMADINRLYVRGTKEYHDALVLENERYLKAYSEYEWKLGEKSRAQLALIDKIKDDIGNSVMQSTNDYLDANMKASLDPEQYNKWSMQRDYNNQYSSLYGQYENRQNEINTKDDQGNFRIDSETERNALLEQARQEHLAKLYTLEADHTAKVKEMNDADYQQRLDNYGNMIGGMTELTRAFAGENSTAYRVMFAAQKGYALAMAIIDGKAAVMKAWASAAFPYNLPSVATAISQTGILQAAMSAVSPKGFSTGGYTGNMGVNDIAGVVHGKEYVLNAMATKRIGVDNLNTLNRGGSLNGGVQVNNYAGVSVTAKQENGLTIIDVRNEIERKMRADMRNPSSDVGKAIYGNSTARPRRD